MRSSRRRPGRIARSSCRSGSFRLGDGAIIEIDIVGMLRSSRANPSDYDQTIVHAEISDKIGVLDKGVTAIASGRRRSSTAPRVAVVSGLAERFDPASAGLWLTIRTGRPRERAKGPFSHTERLVSCRAWREGGGLSKEALRLRERRPARLPASSAFANPTRTEGEDKNRCNNPPDFKIFILFIRNTRKTKFRQILTKYTLIKQG